MFIMQNKNKILIGLLVSVILFIVFNKIVKNRVDTSKNNVTIKLEKYEPNYKTSGLY